MNERVVLLNESGLSNGQRGCAAPFLLFFRLVCHRRSLPKQVILYMYALLCINICMAKKGDVWLLRSICLILVGVDIWALQSKDRSSGSNKDTKCTILDTFVWEWGLLIVRPSADLQDTACSLLQLLCDGVWPPWRAVFQFSTELNKWHCQTLQHVTFPQSHCLVSRPA